MSNFTKVLKKYRDKRGLSQRDLALKLGYSTPQYISNVERGVAPMNLKKISKLAEIVGTKPFTFKNALMKDYKKHLDHFIK